MTIAPPPSEIRQQLKDVISFARTLPSLYRQGHEYAYDSRNGASEVKVSGGGEGRPTEGAFHASGRSRYLLRKASGKIRAAARLLEEADDDLHQIFRQGGPEYTSLSSVRQAAGGPGRYLRR